MDNHLILILSLSGAFVICIIAFLMSMLRFALAKVKFDTNNRKEPSKIEKFILERSRLAAIVTSMSMKLAVGFLMLFIYLAITSGLEMAEIELSFSLRMTLFIVSAIFAIFLQYALIVIPSTHLGNVKADKVLKRLSKPFVFIMAVFIPLEFFGRKLSCLIYGKKIEDELDSFDYIDVDVKLRAEENDASELSAIEETIVKNTMKLPDLDISDIMIPRNQVCYLSLEDDFEENLSKIKSLGHTRFPLCESDLDKCIGTIHLRDILALNNFTSNDDLIAIKKDLLRIGETEISSSAFKKFRDNKTHIALVENEFGGTMGLLTLDCLLEIIVGDIQDEFDTPEDALIRKVDENVYSVLGLTPLHELSDVLDIDMESEYASTMGGLITHILGRFPVKGEVLSVPDTNINIIVDQVERTKVVSCVVKVVQKEE
ncbi:MAG: transporter associated domain-containing protein [Opitutales bacterium]